MADKRIADFATLEEAQDDDLLLVSSEGETYMRRATIQTPNSASVRKKQPTSAWQFLFVPAMRWKTSRRRSGKVTTEE